jgi:hypothetical protein
MDMRKMGRPPGQPKTGGRKPGSVNKKTALLEGFAQTIVENGMQRFQIELNRLDGPQFLHTYLQVFEYVRPKLARAEITGKDGEDFKVNQVFLIGDMEIFL